MGAGSVARQIQGFSRFAISMLVEEFVEQFKCSGGCFPAFPGCWVLVYRDAGGAASAVADVELNAVGGGDGYVFDDVSDDAFSVSCWGCWVVPDSGYVVGERMNPGSLFGSESLGLLGAFKVVLCVLECP